MCSTYVPEGVCSAVNCSTRRQVVLPTVNQHAVVSQSGSSYEGDELCCVQFQIISLPTSSRAIGNSKGEGGGEEA